MYREILEKIREYDSITIFRHQRPDGDAMFSALALHRFLSDNFPQKKIKVAGKDIYNIISRNDRISDHFIINSLAIILDTSILNRIDDERASLASYMIKIDHHPSDDNYGDINQVEVRASACAEILARMFLSRAFKDLILSPETCRYLYCGLISDTINFRTTNVTSETMSIASKLIAKGDLDVSKLVEYVIDTDLDSFRKSTKIRTMTQIRDKFAYVILKESDLKKMNMSLMEAKNNIDELGRIKEINIWALAIENEKKYDCSVRSKRGYVINSICKEYGGGGHVNAAAVKKLDRKTLDHFFERFIALSKKRPVKQN